MIDKSFFERAKGARVLVIGDIMLDKFYYAKLNKFSSDAPIPVAKITKRESIPGGAANVARCLAALGCRPALSGVVGSDHNCETLTELLFAAGVDFSGLVYSDRPTHTKVRVISRDHQVFRLDFDDDDPIEERLFLGLRSFAHRRLSLALDALVLADYEKGVCSEHFCQGLIVDAHSRGVPVIVLPYGSVWSKYRGADLIVANVGKLNRVLLSPIDASDSRAVEAAASYVRRKFSFDFCLATRSGFGSTLSVPEEPARHFSTHRQLLVDPAGAADASVAATSLAVAVGSPLDQAAAFANVVAGVVVSKPGSYAPSAAEVISALV